MALHPDVQPYHHFSGRARLDKSVNSLLGLIEGVSIDSEISQDEVAFLDMWLAEHAELKDRHPYNELVPIVQQAVADRVLTEDEREDIVWLCRKLTSSDFYDRTAADLQRLHGILGGIVADARISEAELRGLSEWMEEHEHLRSCWPYDEIGSLVTRVLADGKIDEGEHALLLRYFAEFVEIADGRTITSAPMLEGEAISGLCSVDPIIEFDGRRFCFTGASSRMTRSELAALVGDRGGALVEAVSKKVDYLVIGADGNPCWAFACYGRKVEKAIELRKAGARILIVHELDFHDACVE